MANGGLCTLTLGYYLYFGKNVSLYTGKHKVIANRPKVILPEIINTDQIGYMANRFCGKNTRLIADIIEYCKINKKPCIILLADFEKAFDSINWSFLKSCIKRFGFGPNFQTWINVMYCNIQSCEFSQPCMGKEIHIVTSTFKRYF